MKRTLLVFTVGPVQSFIASARKTEDLWAGSYMLSYLIKLAIETAEAKAKEVGIPLEVVFPDRPDGLDAVTMTASYPNRFLAVVGDEPDKAAWIAEECQQAVRRALTDMAEKAVEKVFGHRRPEDVSKLQDTAVKQVEGFFEVYWALEPWDSGDYSSARKYLERRLAASKNERPLAYSEQSGLICTMCGERDALGLLRGEAGTYGQMKKELAQVWGDRSQVYNKPPTHEDAPDPEGRIKDGEYLCGICLMKRTARDYFGDIYKQGSVFKAFPSTRDITGYPGWKRLSKGRQETSNKKNGENEEGGYFAVVMMDGDGMGEWLGGEKRLSWAKDMDEFTYQRKLSSRMHRFAHSTVPDLVRQHKGTLVYCGGDDVLTLLSVRDALSFAHKLRQAFSDEEKGLGSDFTASFGLVVAHEKEPLQNVLRWARRMESAAKDYVAAGGEYRKNALGMAVITHSGEIRETVLPWSWPQTVPPGSQSPAEVLISLLLESYQHLSYDFVEHFSSTFLPVMSPSRLHEGKLRILEDSERNKKLLTTELLRLLNRSTEEEKISPARLRHMAELLITLHEILPTSLQFVHLLETLRFFKREEVMEVG